MKDLTEVFSEINEDYNPEGGWVQQSQAGHSDAAFPGVKLPVFLPLEAHPLANLFSSRLLQEEDEERDDGLEAALQLHDVLLIYEYFFSLFSHQYALP